ncbi:SKP1-like protein 4 [Striga hermonthica]|uniref:SKP1-like protein n=1 Tax=Striga hermonthica TaxID=68872 RepID=A0A9N7NC70_STRHE|nr:SKP1-like protein 4 [Striga hermonthica]
MEAKTIVLKSSDDVKFEVEEAVAAMSPIIKPMIDNDGASNAIQIPYSSEVLSKVIEYCRKHAGEESEENLKEFDAEFVKLDIDELLDLSTVAHSLNIQGLLDITLQTVADMMKGMSIEELRKLTRIRDALAHAEEEEIRRQAMWDDLE